MSKKYIDYLLYRLDYIDTQTVECIGKGAIYCKKDEVVRAVTEKIIKVTDVR